MHCPKSCAVSRRLRCEGKKTGQVLVRTLRCENARDFSHGDRIMSGDLNLGAAIDSDFRAYRSNPGHYYSGINASNLPADFVHQ
jgi:hypothetical protein